MLTSRSHAIVLQPKLEDIPDGDWYCYECISKATGDQHCVVCGRRLGKMLSCYNCHRIQHLDCTQPPLQRTPKRWACAVCIHTGKVLALAVTSCERKALCGAHQRDDVCSDCSLSYSLAVQSGEAASQTQDVSSRERQIRGRVSWRSPASSRRHAHQAR